MLNCRVSGTNSALTELRAESTDGLMALSMEGMVLLWNRRAEMRPVTREADGVRFVAVATKDVTQLKRLREERAKFPGHSS